MKPLASTIRPPTHTKRSLFYHPKFHTQRNKKTKNGYWCHPPNALTRARSCSLDHNSFKFIYYYWWDHQPHQREWTDDLHRLGPLLPAHRMLVWGCSENLWRGWDRGHRRRRHNPVSLWNVSPTDRLPLVTSHVPLNKPTTDDDCWLMGALCQVMI